MQLFHIISSNIDSIGYEGNTLYVLFKSGGLYEYYNVPQYIYNGLMSASSHGSFLAIHIKGHYGYRRIR